MAVSRDGRPRLDNVLVRGRAGACRGVRLDSRQPSSTRCPCGSGRGHAHGGCRCSTAYGCGGAVLIVRTTAGMRPGRWEGNLRWADCRQAAEAVVLRWHRLMIQKLGGDGEVLFVLGVGLIVDGVVVYG